MTTTTIGTLVIQNPAEPTATTVSLLAPPPHTIISADKKFAAVIEWSLLAMIVSEGAASTYTVTTTRGASVQSDVVKAMNYALDAKVSADFGVISAEINTSMGWDKSTQSSLQASTSSSVSFDVNLAADTVNVVWQLHITYQALETGMSLYHRVGEYQFVREAVITDFDTFTIELAEGVVQKLPPSPTISGSGSVINLPPTVIPLVSATYILPPTWANRGAAEIELATSTWIKQGNQIGQHVPNQYSTHGSPSICPPWGVQSAEVAALIVAEQAKKKFVSFAAPDAVAGVLAAVEDGITASKATVIKTTAEYNFAGPSAIGFNFINSNYSKDALLVDLLLDRFLILCGGYGNLGGPMAAKARYDAFVKAKATLSATFSWNSAATASTQVAKYPGVAPYYTCSFGSKHTRTVGNSSSAAETQTWGSGIGIKVPFGPADDPSGAISAGISASMTNSTTSKYAISVTQSQSIQRDFKFVAQANSPPFYMAFVVWQVNIAYSLTGAAAATLADSPDLFVIRSQRTAATGGPLMEK
ncbi:MAG: hypothetical protein R8K20_06965 [Gallionellaceae bacterium]